MYVVENTYTCIIIYLTSDFCTCRSIFQMRARDWIKLLHLQIKLFVHINHFFSLFCLTFFLLSPLVSTFRPTSLWSHCMRSPWGHYASSLWSCCDLDVCAHSGLTVISLWAHYVSSLWAHCEVTLLDHCYLTMWAHCVSLLWSYCGLVVWAHSVLTVISLWAIVSSNMGSLWGYTFRSLFWSLQIHWWSLFSILSEKEALAAILNFNILTQ